MQLIYIPNLPVETLKQGRNRDRKFAWNYLINSPSPHPTSLHLLLIYFKLPPIYQKRSGPILIFSFVLCSISVSLLFFYYYSSIYLSICSVSLYISLLCAKKSFYIFAEP